MALPRWVIPPGHPVPVCLGSLDSSAGSVTDLHGPEDSYRHELVMLLQPTFDEGQSLRCIQKMCHNVKIVRLSVKDDLFCRRIAATLELQR